MDKIQRAVKQKLQLFSSFGLVSFLISVSLGLLLSRIILIPIGELQLGVKALKQRRFDYKVKDMGDDEFGSLSRIFNETINDIEELHVAKFVQEKLLPRMDKSLRCNQLRYYGKTIAFDDLGGDYFDVVNVDNEHTGVFVGDVAGHGVAASLIMAFVKACVFMLRPLYKEPSTLVSKINSLFMKTKSKKQRKFMTFQYLLFNDLESSFRYVNAGHCYPIIINPFRRTADFCEMINSPLGASKKNIEKELCFSLEQGEAVVLYSDGFYETGDLGIDGFKEILHKCYDPDPKEYYIKVMSFYESYFESREITDDLTLMIITFPVF
jgi:serine phosphatase RsbU (regulator of sigma subunit)